MADSAVVMLLVNEGSKVAESMSGTFNFLCMETAIIFKQMFNFDHKIGYFLK